MGKGSGEVAIVLKMLLYFGLVALLREVHLWVTSIEDGYSSLGLGILEIEVCVVNRGDCVSLEDEQFVDSSPSEPLLTAAVGAASGSALCHLAGVDGGLFRAVVECLEEQSFNILVVGGTKDVTVVLHPSLHVEIL